jgi:aminomethyltransferase
MAVTATLAQTPLHDWHAAHGGRMVDFAGWSMPVHYGSIVAEHQATRQALGLFDVSHMGRLYFSGRDAREFVDALVTRRTADMTPGQVRYGLMTNDIGGILDDVLVYRVPEGVGEATLIDGGSTNYLMVVNASNRAKVLSWIEAKRSSGGEFQLSDVTEQTAMIAVQGPRAMEILPPLVGGEVRGLKYYHCTRSTVDSETALVSRTGYTGEDGFEVIVPAHAARALWEKILEAGKLAGGMACGLGARDTLRLEAAMPLYGHELSEDITPWQAGLSYAVDLEGRTFPGREVLCQMQQAPLERVRVGLELTGKRVPREHYAVFRGEERVGEVTSGTMSPTLNKPIAMAYVGRESAVAGTDLSVDIRGTRELARVVKLPFYRRSKK